MADLAERLADFALTAEPDADALAVMRLSLLDWAAVGLAGQNEPVSALLRDQAEAEGGAEQAAIFGSATRVPGRMAALVNGTVAHALDYDDTHFAHIGHPSVAVVPAALAAGQIAGAGGLAFQQAALVGAEASVRVGVWLGRDHYQTGFHQTGTAGAFGAAVAAGRLLGLDAGQMRMALGLVSTRASGLKSQFGTMGKPMNAGIAAQNGLEAALLAGRGFVSDPAAIDGPQGFGPTHHGMADAAALEGLGAAWLFTGVHHKFHACCHGLHAALEAVATLPDTPDPIEAIAVHTHPRWLSVCNIEAPETGLEAKFSYRLALSMALCGRDTALLESYTAETCADAEIEEMRRRIDVTADESLSEMQARVIVTLGDGQTRELYHDLDADPGLAVRRQKVQDKAARLIGEGKAGAIGAVLDRAASPEEFAALIAG